MIAIDDRPAGLPVATGDELFHIACCQDFDVALCGIDLSSHEWDENSPLPRCRPCAEMEGADCDQCCPVQALLDLKASSS